MPDAVGVRYAHANALFNAGRYRDCAACVTLILGDWPDFAEAHYLSGLIHLKQRANEAAIGEFQEALRLKPDLEFACINLGVALLSLERWAPAAEAFQRAISLNGSSAMSHANLGVALERMGDRDEAESCYLEAVRLDDSYGYAYENLALLLCEKREFGRAVEHAATAVRFMPHDVGVRWALATCLANAGDVDQAIREYRNALAIHPCHAPALAGLGACLYLAALRALAPGTFEQARDVLRAASVADPANGHVKAMLNRVTRTLAGLSRARRTPPHN
jgi:Flp pilus assembly protein TadD